MTRRAGQRLLSAGALTVIVAACTAAVAVRGDAAPVAETLPDLVADRPANPQLQTYSRPGSPNALLLRFDGYVHNRGAGALEVRGAGPAGGGITSTAQRVYRSNGTWSDDTTRGVRMVWEAEDGHNHWHVKHAARYSLWNSDGTAMVAPAMKVGFCLIDSQHVDSHGPGSLVYTDRGFCGQGKPNISSLVEGVSAGWRDVYVRTLAFQWIDVSDVLPGSYWLRSEIDPDNWARESDENNPPAYASSASTIPGYLARPVDAGIISISGPTSVRLATDSYGGGLGAREFRVTSVPRHGRLSVAAGTPFRGPEVSYTPDPGWLGPDRFTYEARDSTSEFPRHPASAAAVVAVGGTTPAVAISGAPASMYTGATVQLTAHVLRAEGVSWAVNRIPGGSRDVGTINSTGRYTAPARVPPGGAVTIRATTPSGAWEEVTITIVPAPAAMASPAPPARLSTRVHRTTNLYGIRVSVHDGVLLVRLRSRRAGVVRVRALYARRSLGRCRVRTPARRSLTCRVRTRGRDPHRVQLVITLRAKGKLLDVRRASLRRLRHHLG